MSRAHRTLLDRLDRLDRLDPPDSSGLSDAHIPRDALVPGWTVGHVLAHLTHNAQSMTQLFEAAQDGRIGVQYPGGTSQRAADIERDAPSCAEVHIERLRGAIERLEKVWSQATLAWAGRAEMVSGVVVATSDLPLRRWREVEVHMGDLGIAELGFDGPRCWSNEYVRRDVRVLTMQWSARGSMGMNTLPSPVAQLEDRWRLAWLLGRLDIGGVDPAGLI